jgi:hypothetical protein
MKTTRTCGSILSILSVLFFAAGVAAQDAGVRVTIYNDNLALVHETRQVQLPQPVGTFSFLDVAAQIDPTSVHFKSVSNPAAVRVLEQNFEYDLVSADKILQRYLDHDVRLVTKQGDVVGGKLLGTGGSLVLQTADAGIRILNNSEIISTDLPTLPDGLITRPTLVWNVTNDGPADQNIEVSYLTGGIGWHVEYVGVLDADDRNMALTAWVSIDNQSGATFRDAKLLLVAGDVHRAEPPMGQMAVRARAMMAEQSTDFEEKAFFEYHLYTLNRTATLKNNQQKQVELFPAAKTAVTKEYTYDGARDPKKVGVEIAFKNEKESGLGLPLPAGKVRLYKPEGEAQVLVGEDALAHTPRDEAVRLKVGDAFDIVGERTLMSHRQISSRSSEEKVGITLRNHKDVAVKVLVVEHPAGDWRITEASMPHKKKEAHTAEWQVSVAARGEARVEYTVVQTW